MGQENTNQMNLPGMGMSPLPLEEARRNDELSFFTKHLYALLKGKAAQYGERGGFYETNADRVYTHALGEAHLKLKEFASTKNPRMLMKAVGWIYLIWETERQYDRSR